MPSQITPPVLIEITRGPRVESCHRGHIAAVDTAGNLRHSLGDAEAWVCMRSLAKPFQALAVLTSGAAAAFGFGAEELALFSGSLSGQDFQVELATKILTRLGLTAEALQCGVHPPLHRPTAQALAKAGAKPTPLHDPFDRTLFPLMVTAAARGEDPRVIAPALEGLGRLAAPGSVPGRPYCRGALRQRRVRV